MSASSDTDGLEIWTPGAEALESVLHRQRSKGADDQGVDDVTASRETREADLVLAGGGVKGIGLVGAASALLDAGSAFHRVSGTSAGAVVGAVLAAATAGWEPMTGEQL